MRAVGPRVRRHRAACQEPHAGPHTVPVEAVRRSNFVAFVAYFGTFSIFFFTALYLQVVVNASPYQTAIDFLPMAAGLIIVSALTGPLVARVGARGPMTAGCLLAGGGTSSPRRAGTHGQLRDLGWVLPIAGIGLGMLLVPVTSVPLTVVRPERSGMAASATNTSREMGAVFGVAILGSIVNAKLTGDLAAKLKSIGIPPNFQSLVEHTIQTGGASSGGAAGTAEHSKNATVARIATKVVNAAYDSVRFRTPEALVLSGCLILAGAVVAALTIPGCRAGASSTTSYRLTRHPRREQPAPPAARAPWNSQSYLFTRTTPSGTRHNDR